jgi:hypothetical protein
VIDGHGLAGRRNRFATSEPLHELRKVQWRWERAVNSSEANPFGLLTFIVAPAVSTNASSILALSTSNRYTMMRIGWFHEEGTR